MGKNITCDFCEKEIKEGEKHVAVDQDIMCSSCYEKLEKNKKQWFKPVGGEKHGKLYSGQGLTQ